MEFLPVSGPWITQKEIDYVTDAVTNAWYSNAHEYYVKFEQTFARYIGVNYAVSLPSCTSGIHLALSALEIGEADEVIVPDLTWIASAAPVSYVNAKPVFADIDIQTWCVLPESFEQLITPKTRAVIPVDLYGHVADMDVIREIARKHHVAVIEDAAEAVGSEYKGRKAGNLGDVGVFSFHGSKTMTTGEGGMLVTDNKEIYDKVLFLRDHGRQPGDRFFRNTKIAFKYKMSALQAALGLAQVERIGELVAKKREIFQCYYDNLNGFDGVTLNHQAPDTINTYWMVTVVIDKKYGLQKEELMELLRGKNIDSRPFFHPLSSLPAYADSPDSERARQRNIHSYAISPYGVNLPCGMNMDEQKVKYVCDSLKSILTTASAIKK